MKETELEFLQRLIHGASVTEKNGIYEFSRFTGDQRNVYEDHKDFLQKSYSTASVRMEFETDAKSFSMDVIAGKGSSRNFYYFDIVQNGVLICCKGAASYLEQPEYRLELPLDGSLNRICIYFPNLVKISLKRIAFDGASVIEPIRKKRRMICYGDSITQGYDAIHPSLSYPNQLSDALDSEVFNKGIGGEIFRPELALYPDPVRPDMITVAYGTNDWSVSSREDLIQNAEGFFRNLVQSYPDVPVSVILPIWRKNSVEITRAGSFEDARALICGIAGAYPAVHIVDGMKLVPHLEECYCADGLHPNDFGFQFMGKNLLENLPAR